MGKKRLQRLVLFTGLTFMTGYAAHLGGCNLNKIRGYFTNVSNRAGEAYDVAQRTYNQAERLYRQAEPHVKKAAECVQDIKEKIDEETEKKEKEKKDKEKETVIAMK